MSWTEEQVCTWLKDEKFDKKKLIKKIKSEKINGFVLSHMTMDEIHSFFKDMLTYGERKTLEITKNKLLRDFTGSKLKANMRATKCNQRDPTTEVLRKFNTCVTSSFKYKKGGITKIFDQGLSGLLRPLHLFASLDATDDKSRLREFEDETLKFICSCLNSRQNGTIHFGIKKKSHSKEGEIYGTSLIPNQNEYIEGLSLIINKGFCHDDRDVVYSCVRQPQIIEVSDPDFNPNPSLFVIEIDVVPSATVCGNSAFFLRLPMSESPDLAVDVDKINIMLYTFVEGEMKVISGTDLIKFMESKKILAKHREEEEERRMFPKASKDLTMKLTRLLCGGDDYFCASRLFPILVTNRPTGDMSDEFIKQKLHFLSLIPWKAVFDFDDEGRIYNFLESFQDHVFRVIPTPEEFDNCSEINLKNPGRIESLKCEIKHTVNIPWIFTNGYKVVGEKSADPFMWRQTKNKGHKRIVDFFGDEIPAERALIIFCLFSKDWQVMLEAAECFFSVFPRRCLSLIADEYIADPWVEELQRRHYVNDVDIKENMIIGMPWLHICETISSFINVPDRAICSLPTSSNSLITIEKKMINSLSDLDILGSNACDAENTSEFDVNKKLAEVELNYYRGADVDWWNFWSRRQVCERNKLHDLKRRVEDILKGNTMTDEHFVGRVLLFHEPGAGGSTMAKHVLWEFRKDFRCAVIKDITDLTADQVEKFRAYKDPSNPSPVILLLDNQDEDKAKQLWVTLEKQAKRLMRESEHQRIMCLLLICQRKSNIIGIPHGTVTLKQELTDNEKAWFDSTSLKIGKNVNPEQLLSFNIMKEGFNMNVISKTVRRFICAIKDERELHILKYVAFLNTYDVKFQSIPTATFDYFMMDINKPCMSAGFISQAKKTPSEIKMSENFHLLMNRTWKVSMGYIDSLRITNHLLAACVLEILQNLTGIKQMTSDMALEFITCEDIFSSRTGMTREDLLRIMKDILIHRDRSITGNPLTKFAPLIQNIVDNESPKEAKQLLETFYIMADKDPFIAQQLARICMHNEEWDTAKHYAQEATSEQPENSFFWDTYGRIALSQLCVIYKMLHDKKTMSNEDIKEMVSLSFDGISKFERAQSLSRRRNATKNDAGLFGELKITSILGIAYPLFHHLHKTHRNFTISS